MGVFSPPLDAQGNSVRGIRVCSGLSRYLDLHVLNRPAVGRITVRRRLTGAEYGSNRVRPTTERTHLAQSGEAIQLYQLQGNLVFGTTECVISDVLERRQNLRWLILDFKRTLGMNESACYLLHQLLIQLSGLGVRTALSETRTVPGFLRYLRRKHPSGFPDFLHEFPDHDRALEWAEDQFLGLVPDRGASARPVPLSEFDIFRGMEDSLLQHLRPRLRRQTFEPHQVLVEIGSSADALYLIESGTVSVVLPSADDSERRLATFRSGMTFGEMSLLDRAPRSARVVADSAGACQLLGRQDFEALEREHPGVMLAILKNITLAMSTRLRKANAELAVLD